MRFFLFLYCPFFFGQVIDFQKVDFRKADAIALQFKGCDLKKLPVLTYNLTHSLSTDVEKFRAIYTWICTNIASDYRFSARSIAVREKHTQDTLELVLWNQEFSEKVFKRLLKDKKTICTGYAYLVKEMASLANIQCEIINGYGRTPHEHIEQLGIVNHSWNAVKLNNQWYLCDATWSSGWYDRDKNVFIFDYNDGYFLTDPGLFVKNHYPTDPSWLLFKNGEKIDLNAFLNAPIVYVGAFKYGLQAEKPQQLRAVVKQQEELQFVFKKSKEISDYSVCFEIVSGNYSEIIFPKIENLDKETICMIISFKSRGQYDVHLKVNEQLLYTYLIKVKRK